MQTERMADLDARVEELLANESFEDQVVIDEEKLLGEPLAILDESFASIVYVTGLPVTAQAKCDKLCAVALKRIAALMRKPFKPVFYDMPINPESGSSFGYLFIECVDKEEAEELIEAVDGQFMMKDKYPLTASAYSSIEALRNIPDEFDAQAVRDAQEKYHEPIIVDDWLMDDRARSQAALVVGDHLDLQWHDTITGFDTATDMPFNPSTHKLHWTKNGSFLLARTADAKVAELLGGDNNGDLTTLISHPNMAGMMTSNTERYIVTVSTGMPGAEGPLRGPHMAIWDKLNGNKRIKVLPMFDLDTKGKYPSNCPTPLQFSPSDKFIAYGYEQRIQIYSTKDLRKPVRVLQLPGLVDFSWSPADDFLAIFQVEDNNRPAKASIINVPKLCRQLVSRNLYGVKSCAITWHPHGYYFATTTERAVRNGSTTNIDIFRVKNPAVPIETLEYREKKVTGIAFEPRGFRLAISLGEEVEARAAALSGEDNVEQLIQPKAVDIYTLTDIKQGALRREVELAHPAHTLSWSPAGRMLVLQSGPAQESGVNRWVDANNGEVVATREFPYMDTAAWDPTGRAYAVYTSYDRMPDYAGVEMFSHRGQALAADKIKNLVSFMWRPMPESVLTEEDKREINYKEDAKAFERVDTALRLSMDEDEAAKRRLIRLKWTDWQKECHQAVADLAEAWKAAAPVQYARMVHKDDFVEVEMEFARQRSELEDLEKDE
ncbi:Eukaryotic translation initiation factor eIF2A [Carpediemonas membranifera]|uniref:Eukaryotic translation initiation factor eIF2A n=1 Tax=Carpediemonas membranifera TaxID=201153 RepID=A0A8J6DX66_9EUKA|nr:Eukaryotic translation initiation factor eIF2A [Carpediemonas membranifera]|eukprot:KAG9389454.1 Eukaryotic translation initiation factor eIF2A [Carpediemonas membranifera]